MRKAYKTPALYAEVFAMAEHVSANCTMGGGSGTGPGIGANGKPIYTIDDGDIVIYNDFSLGNCTKPEYGDSWDETTINMLCYNTFVEGVNSLFTS